MALLVVLRKLGRQSLRKEESISRLTNVPKLHGRYLVDIGRGCPGGSS